MFIVEISAVLQKKVCENTPPHASQVEGSFGSCPIYCAPNHIQFHMIDETFEDTNYKTTTFCNV